MSAELVIIRGLPGSGKSTMARALAADGYEHFEADQFFEVGGEYRFERERLPAAHNWCLSNAKAALKRGGCVVVSNTFTRAWEMAPYIDAAKRMDVPVRVIEATGAWKNVHGVPPEVVDRMRANWEII